MQIFGEFLVDYRNWIRRVAWLGVGARGDGVVVAFTESPKAVTIEVVDTKRMLGISLESVQYSVE